jgi:hypothetical protein
MIPYALAGAQALIGGAQYLKGRKDIKNLERPEMTTPAELEQNKKLAQQAALEGMPEAVKNQYVEQITGGLSNQIYGARTSGRGFQGAGEALDATNMAFMNLAAMDADIASKSRQELYGANQALAQWNQQKQAMAQEEYQQKLAGAQAMGGAGMQNIMGAADAATAAYVTMNGTGNTGEARSSSGGMGTDVEQQAYDNFSKNLEPISMTTPGALPTRQAQLASFNPASNIYEKSSAAIPSSVPTAQTQLAPITPMAGTQGGKMTLPDVLNTYGQGMAGIAGASLGNYLGLLGSIKTN